MCHRTRQESTTPRLRFSCDLTVARSQVKVTFANTRLPRTVLFAHLEHTITHPEPSSRTIRTWFRSAFDLLEHREHEYSRFIVLLELEVIYSNMANTTMCTSPGRDFNHVPTNVPYYTVGLARTLPGGRAFREGELPGVSPTNFAIGELVEVEKLTPKVN